MKTLLKNRKELQSAGRWDIDFHLPAEGIKKFPASLLKRIDAIADIVRDKRDPTKEPEKAFQYIDISSVDVTIGVITNPQDVEGAEAPSRARKVVSAFDLVISTCRPTRGAIAVVPVKLHDQIASTGFSIVRSHEGINPFYLHYALRLPSTLEQFRKWSTGSSYPAILDADVSKTLIPVPESSVQDAIAAKVVTALRERDKVIRAANIVWDSTLSKITASLCEQEIEPPANKTSEQEGLLDAFTIEEVRATLKGLPPITTDKNSNGNGNGNEEEEE
jgi:type I restriction enzyme S subunit